MDSFTKEYLNSQDYKYKVIITTDNYSDMIAAFKILETKSNKGNGLKWILKNGILNIIAPHLTLEEINNSDDISFRFKHIKFHLN